MRAVQHLAALIGRMPCAAACVTKRSVLSAWWWSLAASAWVLPLGDALSVLNFNERFSQAGLLPPVPTVVSGSFYASLSILDVPWLNPPVDIVFAARVSAWDMTAVAGLRACFRPQG